MLDWPVAMQQLLRGVAYGWEKQGRNCSDPLPFPRDVAYDLDARALPGYQPRRASRTSAGRRDASGGRSAECADGAQR